MMRKCVVATPFVSSPHTSDEELGPIDEALAQIEAGEVAIDADIEAAYSRFRT